MIERWPRATPPACATCWSSTCSTSATRCWSCCAPARSIRRQPRMNAATAAAHRPASRCSASDTVAAPATTSRAAGAAPARRDARRGAVRRRRRAAATRPMRRSTRSCRSACSCRRSERDVAIALDIARDLKVPVLPRGARHQPVRPDRSARRWSSTTASTCAACWTSTSTARTADGRARHRARPPERAAEAARPVVSGRRLDQRAGDARRHGRQQLLRLALASPTATWCTTCSASSAWLSDGALVEFGPVSTPRRARRARSPASCASSPTQHRAEIEARWPKVLRRVGGYNLDIFDNQSERPYTATAASTWRTCWSAPKARWPTRAA